MINVILFQPEIPQNTGNIIRTCFATKATLHIIKPLAFDIQHSSIKRAAAGKTLNDIQHFVYENYEQFFDIHKDKEIYYVTRYGQKNYTDENFKEKKDIWIMFGRESTGIPKNILSKELDRCLRIPMNENCRSLNLANCVSILNYEILRQKNFDGLSKFEVQKGKDFLLTDEF